METKIMRTAVAGKKDPEKVLARYESYFKDNISVLHKAKQGLKPGALFDFIFISDLSQQDIEYVFDKSMKTFQNYLDKKTALDPSTSEKLLVLFALYKKGSSIFGTVDAFSEWLSKPAFGLGNKTPQSFIDTMTGINLVNEELSRIEYGDLA